MLNKSQSEDVLRRNLRWFQRSGVMRPADGFWGVAERLAITSGNEAADKMIREFPCLSRLSVDVVAMEHRRADCNFQVAYLFDLASESLGDPALKAVSDNLIQFLVERSCLRQVDVKNPCFGLWGWATPLKPNLYWTDDNSWVIVLLLKLSERGRPELRPFAVQAARTLYRHLSEYFSRLTTQGRDMPYEAFSDIPLTGLMLNPHWIGLACMALAHAAAVDPETPYRDIIDTYYETVLKGPPKHDAGFAPSPGTGRAWTLSEYGYLALTASVVARQFPDSGAKDIAVLAGRELLKVQQADGHFAAEHNEAPVAAHLADLIYTDNWAVLALQHLYLLTGDSQYLDAASRSIGFLASIQDRSGLSLFDGCWRGMYDTRSGFWGGGDRFEGGANSIYSGWTNAPIAWAFLIDQGYPGLFSISGYSS
jgi:hypothetical protein